MTDVTPVKNATVKGLLDSLLAGASAWTIHAGLDRLPTRLERQNVLCTACSIREEVAASCSERGDEIQCLLAANCMVFDLGRKPCPLQRVFGLSLDNLAEPAA